MAPRKSQNKKPTIPTQEYPIPLRRVEWVALVTDDPMLSGYTFTGRDEQHALINARAMLHKFCAARNLIPIITIKD